MKLIFSLLMLTQLMACSSDPIPATTSYSLDISADSELNPHMTNNSNPVFVRFYQLKDAQAFNQAAFIDLYNKDTEVLAQSLLSKQVLGAALPGSEQRIQLKIHRDTQFLAVLVEFANYQQGEPKALLILPKSSEQVMFLRLAGMTASLAAAEENKSWW